MHVKIYSRKYCFSRHFRFPGSTTTTAAAAVHPFTRRNVDLGYFYFVSTQVPLTFVSVHISLKFNYLSCQKCPPTNRLRFAQRSRFGCMAHLAVWKMEEEAAPTVPVSEPPFNCLEMRYTVGGKKYAVSRRGAILNTGNMSHVFCVTSTRLELQVWEIPHSQQQG